MQKLTDVASLLQVHGRLNKGPRVNPLPLLKAANPPVINLHCGISRLKREMVLALKGAGVPTVSSSEPLLSRLHLILDAPLGWALWRSLELEGQSKVVVSDNPCPEYRLDLLESEPLALLHDVSVTDIVLMLRGEKCASVRLPYTPLSTTERLTLKLIAMDYSNDSIARLRGVETQTVKNVVRNLYQKLYLKTRLQAAHYYFGNWHLLKGWTPPPHVALPEEMSS
ncbi:transcriptional regulator, LuxR family [Truepera radiovictrix DSM 17093]|uniref:Transcriptional regulator, LuxR family n=1 Tax=Truepera radiovictrix (strain DSM 17093 / CIP 108686 / LMG 22925 / RQ-24) TaxID=649638 RepID=D7CTM8_TRURR|nr:transcriptional regulator, LuxR family [Truepera radiovictrix DSM 17093]